MAASRKPLPNKALVDAVACCLARHVPSHARLTLALSGGLDSVVLLHALLALRDQYAFQLQAVHVHHGLSIHADDWALFCVRLCASHAVELHVGRVKVDRDDQAGIEAAARRERQHVFAGLDTDFIVTAHQQDDQAETLVLQLLRGAGPKGLAAMAERHCRPGWRAAQLRPLLGTTRAEILEYARTQGLAWVEDESNQDLRYRRNVLRHQVMPLLAGNFPGSTAVLARAARLQADAAELLDELARFDAASAIEGERLDCAALGVLRASRARNLLRYFIEQQGQPMPSTRRLNEALRQLLDAGEDARVCVRIGPAEIRRFRGGAFVVPVEPMSAEPVGWRGESELCLPGLGLLRLRAVTGQGLNRSRLESGQVTLGLREGGERMRVTSQGPSRSLKNLLQEQAVPPWSRQRLPVLTCDGEPVWVAGIGCHADWLAVAGEPGLFPEWRPAHP
jgi:tRNA(Ile)-lysidine synthase